MLAVYLRFFSRRGVPRIVGAALLCRLAAPVLSLALLLVAVQKLGSYADAGLVLTGHALLVALCAPIGGRLADRYGPKRVLAGFLLVHALSYGLLLLALTIAVRTPFLSVAAALVGATNPPASAVVRGTWPHLVPRESLRTAYAVDNVINELMFVAGPVLVSLLLLVVPPGIVVATAGIAAVLGLVLLITCPAIPDSPAPARPASTTPHRLARMAGPLRNRPVWMIVTIAACGSFTFGCLRIAVVAYATVFRATASAGMLLGLFSAATLAGGLGFGARAWRMTGPRLLRLLWTASAASLLAAAFAQGILMLAVLVALIGLITGPREAIEQVLLSEQASPRQRTEVFSWLNAFMWGGYGIGTAIAGRVTRPAGNGAIALVTAAIAAGLAVAIAIAIGRPLDHPREP